MTPNKSNDKSKKSPLFIDAAVDLPVEGEFTYSVPDGLRDQVRVGVRALVPFGRRTVTAYVTALKRKSEFPKTKAIIDVLDESPLFDKKRLELFRWISSYYFARIGETISLVNPSFVNIKSVNIIKITPEGEDWLAKGKEPSGNAELILKAAASKAVKLGTILKRFKKLPVYSIVNRLKKEGFIEVESSLVGGAKARLSRFYSIVEGLDVDRAQDLLTRSPRRRDLLAFMRDKGEFSLKELMQGSGAGRDAVRALVDKGFIIEKLKEPVFDEVETGLINIDHRPNHCQSIALNAIVESLAIGKYSPFLLYGVTGSGKTLVYVKAIKEALELGKKALVLVPEIALTPKAVTILSAAFPGRVSLLHSALPDGERRRQWQRAVSGRADVVVGTRSALFTPISGLGLIIIDEEHDGSYKQEEGVRYSARDAAQVLGKKLGITVVMGSATPSVETFYNAKSGKIALLTLPDRVRNLSMPKVELTDMREELKLDKARLEREKEERWLEEKKAREARAKAVMEAIELSEAGKELTDRDKKLLQVEEVEEKKSYIKKEKAVKPFSENLLKLLGQTLERGEQVLIFLNRRGFSNFILCSDCGYIFECPNCTVTLTLHRGIRSLKCHYCDFTTSIPDSCPKCSGAELHSPGAGTERIEALIASLFPEAVIARLDRDTVSKKGAIKEILDDMDARKTDILIGTQMVAKGHDFPGITLVGIINGDSSLAIPDFRGSERTFQLISQASGRAGRGGDGGATASEARVVIQTMNHEHPCFLAARDHDYDAFYKSEIEERRAASYPPFTRLALLRIDSTSEDAAMKGADSIAVLAMRLLKEKKFSAIAVLGPAPALVARLRGRYRRQLLIKGLDARTLNHFIREIKSDFDSRRTRAILTIDMDPLTTV